LAIVQSCYAIGWAVSTTAYLTLYSIFPPEIAWRYLFLIGIIPALAAFVIRRTTKDATEISGQSKPDEGKSEGKFARLFKADLRARTLSATLLGVGVQGIYYSVFIFLPTYQIGRAHVELQSRFDLVCRLLLEKKKTHTKRITHI